MTEPKIKDWPFSKDFALDVLIYLDEGFLDKDFFYSNLPEEITDYWTEKDLILSAIKFLLLYPQSSTCFLRIFNYLFNEQIFKEVFQLLEKYKKIHYDHFFRGLFSVFLSYSPNVALLEYRLLFTPEAKKMLSSFLEITINDFDFFLKESIEKGNLEPFLNHLKKKL